MPHFPWEQYGIIGGVVGILFFILFRMLTWVMAFIKEMTKQHNEERMSWLTTLNTLNQSIVLHNQGSVEARKTQEEAHKYQREEHIRMSESLNAINGSLKETEKALGRINGYVQNKK